MPKKAAAPLDNHLPTETFTVNGATITVRQETGWDVMDSRILWNKLLTSRLLNLEDEVERARMIDYFIPAVVRTVAIEGDLGFPWVTAHSTPEALAAAYQAFGDSSALVAGYTVAFYAVDRAVPATEELTAKKASTSAQTTS